MEAQQRQQQTKKCLIRHPHFTGENTTKGPKASLLREAVELFGGMV